MDAQFASTTGTIVVAGFSVLHLKCSHSLLLNYINNKTVVSLWTVIRLQLEMVINFLDVLERAADFPVEKCLLITFQLVCTM